MASTWTKEGWLIKRSGFLWKSWEKRYFRLARNKLMYFITPFDTSPKRIIELDGCSLEITSSGEEGAPFSFTLTERTHEPHAYYFAFNDHQVMDAWVVAIQRASLYFLEILYAAIIQDDKCIMEEYFAHWEEELPVFRSLANQFMSKKMYKCTNCSHSPRGGSFSINHKDYTISFLSAGDTVLFCIVDKRVANYKAEAFLEDLRERFENVSLCTENTVHQFSCLLHELMQVYSPGYDGKDPGKVNNAKWWIKRALTGQEAELTLEHKPL